LLESLGEQQTEIVWRHFREKRFYHCINTELKKAIKGLGGDDVRKR
jgi:hypothetical protein